MEAQQGFPFKPQPMTLLAYEVDCANIVDLSNSGTLDILGYSTADLACAWEDLFSRKQDPPTWKLADQLQALGISGVRSQSFAPGCTERNINLVLWKWSNSSPNTVRVIDGFGHFPKSKDSWGDE